MRILPVHILLLMLVLPLSVTAQNDSMTVNQDAIYNRPFIQLGQTRTAVGGYLEGNTNYFSEDGVSEGFSMEMRRFNIFLYAPVGKRIRFLSELEFEHGTEEIALETAILDFELNPAFNFRAGMLLPAIGLVNTNHDSPNWDFIDRPLSSTTLIPTTLSEIGFGVHGKFYPNDLNIISYDAYLTNGLQENVILNAEGRTHLASGKSPQMFAEDNNGEPMLNARISLSNRKRGELGFAYYGGAYNRYRIEGAQVDERRALHVYAMDFQTQFKKLRLRGEAVLIRLNVPDALTEIYGNRQYGGFAEFTYPVYEGKVGIFEKAVLNLAVRAEFADYNNGHFYTNIESPIGDEDLGLSFALGFRPRAGTVIRFNYQRHFITDALGNPAANLAGFQFGVASYF